MNMHELQYANFFQIVVEKEDNIVYCLILEGCDDYI